MRQLFLLKESRKINSQLLIETFFLRRKKNFGHIHVVTGNESHVLLTMTLKSDCQDFLILEKKKFCYLLFVLLQHQCVCKLEIPLNDFRDIYKVLAVI